MSDQEETDSGPISQEEKDFERKINKEIEKLQFFLEDSEELLENDEYDELDVALKRSQEIQDRLNDLVSNLQELKIELGITSQRAIRKWKKDLKATYTPLLEKKSKLCRAVESKQREANESAERESLSLKYQKEKEFRREMQEREKELFEGRMEAELEMTEKKIEMEKAAKAPRTKLPELKITPFKGTPADWIRFENMFISQIDKKSISDEEKFGYLLELVGAKVRDRFSNLRPSAIGYKTAWERLKTEYGHTKMVIAAHMDEVINLSVVRGTNYEKVREFYEKLSKNYDALQTLGEGDSLKAFMMSTINKLPQVKPDLVRTDDDWEDWEITNLLEAIQKWLKRNRVEEVHKDQGDHKKREKHLYGQKSDATMPSRGKGPVCVFCDQGHWGDSCTTYDTVESASSSLQREGCVSTVPARDTKEISAAVEGVLNAKGNTTRASARGTMPIQTIKVNQGKTQDEF